MNLQTYLHSAVSALKKVWGLAAPIIILGGKTLPCLYFFKPITVVLGGAKTKGNGALAE